MSDIHLVVLIHGMWGQPSHVSELRRVILEKYPDVEDESRSRVRVLLAETNRNDSTYDGIDWGGERVAQEITEEVEKLEKDGQKVTKFSALGYSLGGLLARYVIGILSQRGFFDHVRPMNFNTIATPHIGLPKFPQFFSSLAANLAPTLLSRTGEQFYCTDKWSATGRPLLEVMADPDRLFYQALTKFENITIYANAVNDRTVSYITACLESEDPFSHYETNGIEIEMDSKYPHIIKSYKLPDVPPPRPPKPIVLSPRWFKAMIPSRPLLPPALQLRFPLNILIYIALPLLIPVFVSLAVVRLSLAARSSRARIRLLETDESNSQRLVHILNGLEKQMQDAVADFIDESQMQSTSTRTGASTPEIESEVTQVNPFDQKEKKSKKQPLSPLQLSMMANLNKIPKLRKERAFFADVRNSHAVIVCRDVKNFDGHKLGASVLMHWADRFIV